MYIRHEQPPQHLCNPKSSKEKKHPKKQSPTKAVRLVKISAEYLESD